MIRPLVPLAMVLCVALPISAWASPKVALTAIDGDSSGDVRDDVATALDGKDLTLIGMKEVNRAYDKLGDIAELSEKAAKKLAKDLEADAIVQGRLAKQNGKKKLSFTLFVNGKKLKGFSIQFKSAKAASFQSKLRDKMVEKIEGASSEASSEEDPPLKGGKKGKPAPVEDEEDPLATKGSKGAKGKKGGKVIAAVEEEDPPAKGKGAKGKKVAAETAKVPEPEEREVAKAEPADSKDEDPAPRKAKKKVAAAEDDDEDTGRTKLVARSSGGSAHTANRAAARIDAGVSVMKRTLEFATSLPANQAPKPFKPSPVPGARVEADLYPLAFLNPKSFASGLGVGFEYDKTITMNVGTSDEPNTKIPVNSVHWGISGKFRIAFGKTATSPTATLGFGYGRRRFIANRSVLMPTSNLDLPDTDYKYLAPSLAFRIPIGTMIAFIAGGEGILVRDAGQIQTAASYGKAKIFGLEAQAGFDIVLGNRFAVRLIGEFAQIGYTFVGAGGMQANNRDGNPDTLDVGGAADRSFGGAATLAVLY
jgi:hypothetical protein